MEFCQLLEAFAKAVGITETITPDDDGIVRIGYDDDRCVEFVEHPERRMLGVHTVVGEMPAGGADKLREGLLRANFVRGDAVWGALSTDDAGRVCLCATLSLDALGEPDGFLVRLRGFVETAQAIRKLIEAKEIGNGT